MALLVPSTAFGEKDHAITQIRSSGSQTNSSDLDSDQQRRPPLVTSTVASRSRSQRRDDLRYNFVPAVVMTTLPFIAILGVLLYLVFSRRLERGTSSLPELSLPGDNDDPGAYFVDFNATHLTTLASWASTIAGLSPGFIMTLVSYRVARRLSRYSVNRQIEKLPTTYQLGLLFEGFEAKVTSLWDTLWYLAGKRRHRINGLLSYTLTFLLLASTLSTVIWAVDTWFQVTMSAVIVSQMSPSKSAAQAYGDKIPDTCMSSFNRATLMAPQRCDGPVYLGDPYQIIMNVSSHRQILTGSHNGTDFSFLAPANPRPDIDFKATTFAASSSCYPISRRCNMAFQYSNQAKGERSGGVAFNCSENFKGNVDFLRRGNQESYSAPCVNNQAGCVGFFSDSSLNIPFNNTSLDHTLNAGTQLHANPFFAGVLGYFIISDGTTGLESDPEVSAGVGKWFILGCEITIHEYTYIWINNTITSGTITPASDEVAAVVRQVITLNDPSAYQQFAYNVQLSTFMSNSSSQIAASYSQHLEKTLLAWSAASWEPTATQLEQIRRNLLVTRVPKTPLFTLVTLCLLFVALSITITVIVLLDESGPTSEIQSRLNVFGLVASRFDGAERSEASPGSQEDGSEEGEGRSDDTTKIGIVKTRQGGWNYVSF